MCLGDVAEYVATNDLSNCTPKEIEESINKKLNIDDYGVSYEYFKIIGYAVVKTYRLIQDGNWMPDGLSLTQKQ